MWTHRAAALVAGLSLAIPARPLAAQTDYRNLDREPPVTTEDAYPVERHAFELLIPFRTEQEQGGERLHLVPLEIEYGLFDNAHFGLGLPIGAVRATTPIPNRGWPACVCWDCTTSTPRVRSCLPCP